MKEIIMVDFGVFREVSFWSVSLVELNKKRNIERALKKNVFFNDLNPLNVLING